MLLAFLRRDGTVATTTIYFYAKRQVAAAAAAATVWQTTDDRSCCMPHNGTANSTSLILMLKYELEGWACGGALMYAADTARCVVGGG